MVLAVRLLKKYLADGRKRQNGAEAAWPIGFGFATMLQPFPGLFRFLAREPHSSQASRGFRFFDHRHASNCLGSLSL